MSCACKTDDYGFHECELCALRAKVKAYDKLVGDYDELIEKSRKWYHDSNLWEGDEDLGPLWQELWNRRGDLSK